MKAMLKTAGIDLSVFPQAKRSATGSTEKIQNDVVNNTPPRPSIRQKGGQHGTSLPSGANTPLESQTSGGLSKISLPSC